jgi:UDP-glucose 4-epimerase
MEELRADTLYFASSSAIYGDHGDAVLSETSGPLFPASNYGAMKLASEAAICAAAERFLKRAVLFRFPNVVGVPATHGVILDFIRKLQADPTRLPVLGDGTQRKAYLHVSDLIDAMLAVRERAREKVCAINIGPIDDGITVSQIATDVVRAVSPGAATCFGTGNRGWVGDVPRFRYSVEKLLGFGWRPTHGSLDAVRLAIAEVARQEGAA